MSKFITSNHGGERTRFLDEVRHSSLPDTGLLAGVTGVAAWDTALRQLAAVLPDDAPSIVVLDELPWMLEGDPVLEGTLQTVWDRVLSRKPVLLVLIGSDLAMMERLSAYGRPFHQRGVEMVLAPLSPAEVMAMTGLPAADAFDAHLITGGLPLVCQEWQEGESRAAFLSRAFDDPTSPLLVSGERALAADPDLPPGPARAVRDRQRRADLRDDRGEGRGHGSAAAARLAQPRPAHPRRQAARRRRHAAVRPRR
ncbi:AAA family ATPase [Streptomyces acidiscabies]|uniref:AAA family ATPase n=1 Tax=Streptomyces acidiscabies TaxID=42234 RepID=UPI000ADBAE89|nr:hypothetical protein [Streptomyces acidiscabies]